MTQVAKICRITEKTKINAPFPIQELVKMVEIDRQTFLYSKVVRAQTQEICPLVAEKVHRCGVASPDSSPSVDRRLLEKIIFIR